MAAAFWLLPAVSLAAAVDVETTTAVVTSITLVIIADAIFAVLTRSVGMP